MVGLLPYKIHIIENSQADFLALRRAITINLKQMEAEAEFTRHLTAEDAYQSLLSGEKPDLMFVDLNLQGENGIAFLRRVKSDRRIDPCPKVILTTSTAESDVKQGFLEGAAGYLVKPMTYEELVESVRICLDYWFFASRRPAGSPGENDLMGGPPTPRC